jgi:hypothetical protein
MLDVGAMSSTIELMEGLRAMSHRVSAAAARPVHSTFRQAFSGGIDLMMSSISASNCSSVIGSPGSRKLISTAS